MIFICLQNHWIPLDISAIWRFTGGHPG